MVDTILAGKYGILLELGYYPHIVSSKCRYTSASLNHKTDIRLFGKHEAFKKRRMGVALAYGSDVDDARKRAKEAAGIVKTVVE